MTTQSCTHSVEVRGDVVIKRFRAWQRDEHEREWRALRLLRKYAPGLAPEPLRAALGADPPEVVMTRLAGDPLRGGPVSQEQGAALAAAIAALHSALPGPVLDEVPIAAWDPAGAADKALSWTAAALSPGSDPLVAEAHAAGARWLKSVRLRNEGPGHSPVFGMMDGNLANYLWDGERIRLVDFEVSGRSDRAFELAEMAEHISTWVDSEFDTAHFLGHFDLCPAEATRLRECRRLVAMFWLLGLAHDDSARTRNPPGSLERQAQRVLALLD